MGELDSGAAGARPGLLPSARSLVAELRGRRAPTFVARDDFDATRLFVVEHLTLDGDLRVAALERVEELAGAPHPRLARLHGALQRASGIDVVSDFIDGELLSELQATLYASGRSIPSMCALRFIADVLSGLHALHSSPAFAVEGHGSLSPRSIVVGLDGRVRLVELVRDRPGARRIDLERYVAPEVIAGAPTSPRADLYAAGMILADTLEGGPSPALEEIAPFLEVARCATAPNPVDRFETAAAMLSALAGAFQDRAPSHADVARLMAATSGERIRARRAALETAPVTESAEVRLGISLPRSMPVSFAEPLPGSRNASPWPGALRAQSLPSFLPPPSRPTDRPPPVSSGAALPRVSSAPPHVDSETTDVTPGPPVVLSGPPPEAAPRTPAMPRVTPASVPPPPARPAVSPPAEAATPSPPIEAAVSSRPPRANGAVARESKPTDSWRYASAGPVDPPRRAVTLPVPAESIIVESVDLDDRTQPRGQAIAPHEILQPPHILMPQSSVANASAPPSVRQVPTIPPGASMPPRQVTSDFPVPSRSAAPRSHVVPVTLALVAFAGLAAGGFVLLGRRASSHDRAPPAARAAVSAVVAPAAPSEAPAVAPPVVAPAARPRCPEGMVLIEGGLFTMGSDAPDAIAAVKPAHPVTVATFCIDALEVSVARFKACSDAGECKRGLLTNEWAGISTLERVAYEPMCNLRDPVGLAAHPINCVDWERADIYCTAHGSRLPTEAEWELAARGRDNRSYPWGNEPPAASLLNACGPECATWATKNGLDALAPLYDVTDGWLGTAPGRTFPAGATPEGVADLAGNVAEWVADAYAPYTSTSQTSPVVTSGDARVVRGGSFVSGKLAAISPTYRTREKITKRSSTLGFRCAGAPVAAAGK